jgi:hypothetical protein
MRIPSTIAWASPSESGEIREKYWMSLFFIIVLETPANMRFSAMCKKDSSNTTKTQTLFRDASILLGLEARVHFLSFVNGFIQPQRLYCIVTFIFHSNLSPRV